MTHGTRTLLLLSVLALAAGPVAASTVEDAIRDVCAAVDPTLAEECVYQVDGGRHGDASDDCGAPDPTMGVGVSAFGMLAPPDDPEDNFALHVPQELVSTQLTVTIASALPSPGRQEGGHKVEVWAPSASGACATHLGTATGLTPLTFVAESTGPYTLRVLPAPLPQVVPPHSQPRVCHFMCLGTVSNATGFEIQVG